MDITSKLLCDYFRRKGWPFHKRENAVPKPAYTAVKLLTDCYDLRPDYLYIIDEEYYDCSAIPADCDICMLGKRKDDTPDSVIYFVQGPKNIFNFFSNVQQLFEVFSKWELTLNQILLKHGSFQDILDCSREILLNPCVLMDNQFNVLAYVGDVSKSQNTFFCETIKNGKPPIEFFKKLMRLPYTKKSYYVARQSVYTSQNFSAETELMSNCIINDIPVVRFFMSCTEESGEGMKDVVVFLMSVIQKMDVTNQMAAEYVNHIDYLFSQIIDFPRDPNISETAALLEIDSHQQFCLAAIALPEMENNMNSFRDRLQAIAPYARFFIYRGSLFAFLLNTRQSVSADLELSELKKMLAGILDLNKAAYAFSFSMEKISDLTDAYRQASFALSLREQKGTTKKEAGEFSASSDYSSIMIYDILYTFFKEHDFNSYCPTYFRRILNDAPESRYATIELLLTYLQNNCNTIQTAEALHMHRNSVYYRIHSIQDKYSVPLDDPQQMHLLLLLCIYAKHYM